MVYETLSRQGLEVRILDLAPSDKYDADIQCDLQKISLLKICQTDSSNTQSFEALSYTWGGDVKDKCVTINGEHIQVTSNLEAFLRHRRDPVDKAPLWVDAICINQSDAQERNFQVSIMNLIYAAAKRLTIWLGSASNDSSLAVQTLLGLGAGSPYDKMPLLHRKEVIALENLLSRPWWTRVWIVQEVVCGGMGTNQQKVTVRCGSDSVRWNNVVIAAARIAAYAYDQRQMFPNIDNILELDSLRERAFQLLSETTCRRSILDLVCRYRHFQASEPRDKLYAISNLLAIHPVNRINPRYEDEVRNIYRDFAMETILDDQDLDILRYCGPFPSEHNLPSWVPDWSVPLGMHPLPVRRIKRYYQVPWWANPITEESDRAAVGNHIEVRKKVYFRTCSNRKDSAAASAYHQRELKKLEIGARGYGRVRDLREIPSDFTFHKSPEWLKNEIRTLLPYDNFVFMVQDQRCLPPESDAYSIESADALRQGEIITERRVKRWLLQELDNADTDPKYYAAGSTQPSFRLDRATSALHVKVIIWDTIEVIHEAFIEDLEADWKNATRFMVAVGSCKSMTVHHAKCSERYRGSNSAIEAFWMTISAGQAAQSTKSPGAATSEVGDFTQWLPETPQEWKTTTPPVTPLTSGLLELTQASELMSEVAYINGKPIECRDFWPESERITPEQWPDNDKEAHKAELKAVSDMWHQQPYDLYHRPFSFLHVIPDPYWHVRRDRDDLALKKTQASGSSFITSIAPRRVGTSVEDDPITIDELRRYSVSVDKAMTSRPSMVPRGTLDPGIEKYALGRKFFITNRGYIGLAPKTAKAGDQVAVFFGSNVPFVIRKYQDMPGQQNWQLVGETYVHGAMNGEIFGQLDQGLVDSRDIHLL